MLKCKSNDTLYIFITQTILTASQILGNKITTSKVHSSEFVNKKSSYNDNGELLIKAKISWRIFKDFVFRSHHSTVSNFRGTLKEDKKRN